MENHDIDDETRLDISWINEQSRIQNIHQNYFKEPMENINAYYLFINKNSSPSSKTVHSKKDFIARAV